MYVCESTVPMGDVRYCPFRSKQRSGSSFVIGERLRALAVRLSCSNRCGDAFKIEIVYLGEDGVLAILRFVWTVATG